MTTTERITTMTDISDTAEAPPPDTVPGELLVRLAAEEMRIRERAEADRKAWEAKAEYDAGRAASVSALRAFLAGRVGQPWSDVRAEAEAELARVEADLPEAVESLRQAQEAHRDAIGVERYFRARGGAGATAFTEWGVRWEDDAGQSHVHEPLDDEETARDWAANVLRGGAVVRQEVSITRGPWEPAP
jgi:hypothetical protein